jgi:hypothetical protein
MAGINRGDSRVIAFHFNASYILTKNINPIVKEKCVDQQGAQGGQWLIYPI